MSVINKSLASEVIVHFFVAGAPLAAHAQQPAARAFVLRPPTHDVLPRARTVSRCMRSDRQEFGVGAAHSVMALSVSGARPRFARQLPFLLLVFSFKAKKKRKKRTSTKPIWRAGRTRGAITFVQNHDVERMKNRRKTQEAEEEASGCGNAFVESS